MNTAAPHALKKRLLTLALSLAFLLTCLPAALAVDLNVDAGFYFKQSRANFYKVYLLILSVQCIFSASQ